MSFVFDRVSLHAALDELAHRLDAEGLAVTIHIVGGGAVMLSVRPDRGGTKDVDAWINADSATKSALRRHIEQMAAENGWTSDWVNENAKNFIPEAVTGHQRDWAPYLEVGNVLIVLARADVLLAMKLHAGRPLKDLPDLPALAAAAEVTTAEHAISVYEGHFPDHRLRASALNWIETHLPHE